MRRRTFEEMITYFNQTVSEMDIDRKYKMTLLGIVTALLQKHDEELAKNSPKVNSDSGELISRQAAYETLTEYYHHTTEIQHKALREALERVPDVQPCEDLISRKAAIDAVYKCADIFAGDMPVMVVKSDAYEALAQLPSAQPEKRTENTRKTHGVCLDTISRNAAIEAMEDVDWHHINSNGQLVHGANSKEDEPLYKAEDVYKVLNDIPSAQSEIVRCKDCRYMTEHYDTDGNVPYWTCSEWDSGTDYDGFCHYAERRTDEAR